jgi:uncharacterized protein YceH (UPF0502 family)
LDGLNEKGLAGASSHADSRVTKYEHRFQEVFNFTRPETALLCVLLLRGHQTPGELRGRAERIHRFEELDQVQSTLQRLMQHDPPMVKVLARQPGTKESRYAHLLSGDVDSGVSEPAAAAERTGLGAETASPGHAVDTERMARLEDEIARLRQEIADLKQQLAAFRKQFE